MSRKAKKVVVGIIALAALGLGGSALAGAAPGTGKDKAAQERSESAENGKDDAGEKAGGKEGAGEEAGGKDEAERADKPVTGSAAASARKAAEAKTGGKAGDVERESEKGAAYDVEVVRSDGSKVDVSLDDQFKVVGVDSDKESGHDDSGDKPAATK